MCTNAAYLVISALGRGGQVEEVIEGILNFSKFKLSLGIYIQDPVPRKYNKSE